MAWKSPKQQILATQQQQQQLSTTKQSNIAHNTIQIMYILRYVTSVALNNVNSLL